MKQDKDELKTKIKIAKDQFMEMLSQCTAIDSSSKWNLIMPLLENDHRYKAVTVDRDRSELFYEYIDDLNRKEKLEFEMAKQLATNMLATDIEEGYKSQTLTTVIDKKITMFTYYDVQHKEAFITLRNKDIYKILTDIDVKRIYMKYCFDLENKERELERARREAHDRLLSEKIVEYKQLLDKYIAEGTITYYTTWLKITSTEEYLEHIKITNDTPYKNLLEIAENKPKDVFAEVSKLLQFNYRLDKKVIKTLLQLSRFHMKSSNDFDEE